MNDKVLAILTHLGGLLGYLIIPFVGSILTPLAIWGIGKTPERPLLDQHGKEVINFQISILIYIALGFLFLIIPAVFLSFGTLSSEIIITFIGSYLILAIFFGLTLAVFEFICVIVAIIRAIQGRNCYYPLTIRLIK